MKFVVLLLAVLCVSNVALASQDELPPGYNSADELASVLSSEPESARFAEQLPSGCGASPCGADTVTFTDAAGSSSASAPKFTGEDDETAEFDAQIEQVKQDIKKLKENIKESEECARRLKEQQAEYRSLNEQVEHLQREKEKKILQNKLEKQMKDLSEINRMSRALRSKFQELKRTQNLIKTKMTGTRTTLQQLDNEAEGDADTDDIADKADQLGADLDAMHSKQLKVLQKGAKRNRQAVVKGVNDANALAAAGSSSE